MRLRRMTPTALEMEFAARSGSGKIIVWPKEPVLEISVRRIRIAQ